MRALAQACRFFFCSLPALSHDAPFARHLLAWAVRLYQIRPRIIRLDAAYWGVKLIAWIHGTLGAVAVIRLSPQTAKEPLLFASHAGPGRIWANAVALNAFLVGFSSSFTSNALLSSFWSTMVRQVSSTYTATSHSLLSLPSRLAALISSALPNAF